MPKNFYDIKRSVKFDEKTIRIIMEMRFEKLRNAGFDYSKVEDDDFYSNKDDYIDHKIDCIQANLDHVRTWNHKLHRQRLLRDYEDHMKRSGDFL